MLVIVTGGTKGIGRAIAEIFAEHGNQVVLCSRNGKEAATACEEIMEKHEHALVVSMEADLSKKEEVMAFGKFCLEKGVPDVLVNNAGTYLPGNVLNEEDGTLEKLIETNLYSAYYLSRVIGAAMKNEGRGHIFNISSIAGLKAYENGGSYSISKFAMNGLSANLRHELMDFGVKVTNVLPGAVFTDSWAGFDNSNSRLMEAGDIAKAVYAATRLSAQAVVEKIILRPQKGDL